MTKKTLHFSFRLLALDFNLLNISFFLMNYWKRGTSVLSPLYLKLLIAFYIIWLVVSLLTKKFHFGSYTGYWDVILYPFYDPFMDLIRGFIDFCLEIADAALTS